MAEQELRRNSFSRKTLHPSDRSKFDSRCPSVHGAIDPGSGEIPQSSGAIRTSPCSCEATEPREVPNRDALGLGPCTRQLELAEASAGAQLESFEQGSKPRRKLAGCPALWNEDRGVDRAAGRGVDRAA